MADNFMGGGFDIVIGAVRGAVIDKQKRVLEVGRKVPDEFFELLPFVKSQDSNQYFRIQTILSLMPVLPAH